VRRDGVLIDNPAEFIGTIRERGNARSERPFSLAEIQVVLAVADAEWRSLIIFGIYGVAVDRRRRDRVDVPELDGREHIGRERLHQVSQATRQAPEIWNLNVGKLLPTRAPKRTPHDRLPRLSSLNNRRWRE
jgi:hypothetical protein